MAKTNLTAITTVRADEPAEEHTLLANAVLYHRIACDKFGELAAIFDILARRLPEDDDLQKLARLGKDVAQDYEGQADCWREELEKKVGQ